MSASFTSYDPHSVPTDRERNKAVYYAYLFMTGLLIAVFVFFTIHALLWLQRSVVAGLRGELTWGRRYREGPWIRRFQRIDSRLHLVVVVSFLLLALTGLPLKYHYTPWAQALAHLLGGVGMTSLIHRGAALVTFGYFLFHILHLGRRGVVEKETGLLWGWRSMVPQIQDLRDFRDNLRYFFYLGKRPAFDRWTYWEKFDYFAVFWGVAIIGLSGLALWLPQTFSRLLPGWGLNVAHVIHSDEALLATGFIFVFHFFNTHLRPEAFPMDPVIFVGSMPLERFKEERPQEYERLVAEGRLEELLVERPPTRLLRRAHFIGFAALTLGLVLAVAILWGLTAY